MFINRFFGWIHNLLSGPDGNPSSTRVLMFAFSIFSMRLIWRCFYHIYQLHDVALVSLWLANMPLLIATLMGFISLPYTINRGASAISDLLNSVANKSPAPSPTTNTKININTVE